MQQTTKYNSILVIYIYIVILQLIQGSYGCSLSLSLLPSDQLFGTAAASVLVLVTPCSSSGRVLANPQLFRQVKRAFNMRPTYVATVLLIMLNEQLYYFWTPSTSFLWIFKCFMMFHVSCCVNVMCGTPAVSVKRLERPVNFKAFRCTRTMLFQAPLMLKISWPTGSWRFIKKMKASNNWVKKCWDIVI